MRRAVLMSHDSTGSYLLFQGWGKRLSAPFTLIHSCLVNYWAEPVKGGEWIIIMMKHDPFYPSGHEVNERRKKGRAGLNTMHTQFSFSAWRVHASNTWEDIRWSDFLNSYRFDFVILFIIYPLILPLFTSSFPKTVLMTRGGSSLEEITPFNVCLTRPLFIWWQMRRSPKFV